MTIEAIVPLLNVADAERSIAFYTGILSFQVAQKSEVGGSTAWALLRCGAARLMLERSEPRAVSRGAVLYLYVDSARDCHAALTARGVAAGDVTLGAHGLEEFRFRDPDGHELAVASPAMRIA